MIRRRPKTGRDGLEKLVSETQDMVNQLLRENHALKAHNQKLIKELDRLSAGWEAVKKLARSAPKRSRRSS